MEKQGGSPEREMPTPPSTLHSQRSVILVQQEEFDSIRQGEGRDGPQVTFSERPADTDAAEMGESLRDSWE